MKVSWCQEHETNGGLERCRFGGGCRMVPMRLIPDNTESVQRIATLLSENDFDHDCNAQHHLVVALGVLDVLDGETP